MEVVHIPFYVTCSQSVPCLANSLQLGMEAWLRHVVHFFFVPPTGHRNVGMFKAEDELSYLNTQHRRATLSYI